GGRQARTGCVAADFPGCRRRGRPGPLDRRTRVGFAVSAQPARSIAATGMNSMTSSAELAESAAGPLAARRPGARPRRLPLRATGLLAIAGAMILAMLLVASTLVFRSAAQANLEALEQAQARHGMLLERRLAESATNRSADQLHALDQQLRDLAGDRAQRLAETRHYIDGVTITIACLAWLGITSIGALAMLFFSRLALDIGTV